MKVLFLTTKKLLPMNDGGLIGSNGILRLLFDLGLEITLVNFYEKEPYSSNEEKELKNYVKEIYTLQLKYSRTEFNFSFKYPNNIRKYTRKNMKVLLKRLNEEKKFAIVVIDHVQMFEYSKLFEDARIILHTHNVENNLWYEFARNRKFPINKIALRNAKMLYDYEKKAIEAADGVLACSDTDKKVFQTMSPKCNVVTLHSYVKFEKIKEQEDIYLTDNSILFIGAYSWEPNVNAANFLINEVMPRLRKKRIGTKLYLVGKSPTKDMVESMRNHEDIIVTGLVSSIDSYIKKCDIFVNPVVDGSGINIKVIEAMGKGIPVISSAFGFRGFDKEGDKKVLIYEDLDQCVEQIISLLENKQMRLRLSDNARKYYLEFIKPGEDVKKMLI